MTGHKGNSEFCFHETLKVPRGEAKGNIEVEGKQNSLFPEGPVLSVLLYLPTQKWKKLQKKLFAWGHCVHWLRSQNWAATKTNLFYRKVTITVFFFAANKKYRQYQSCFVLF